MRENVTISYRCAGYELGRGPGYYGIWAAVAPPTQPPLEWWPETADGWAAAWARFAWIAPPGSITQAGDAASVAAANSPAVTIPLPAETLPAATMAAETMTTESQATETVPAEPLAGAVPGAGPDAGPGALVTETLVVGAPEADSAAAVARRRRTTAIVAAGLLALGVCCGFAGLFPGYVGGSSLASEAPELVPHLLYLAAWAASAVLVLLGGTRARTGALLGAGTSAVTLGLFVADAGPVISSGTRLAGAGLVLGLLGWLGCAAGSVLALAGGPDGRMARPHGTDFAKVALLAVAGVGTALTFAPSWDSYTLQNSAGLSQSLTAGNAFANPGPVIAGDVIAMIAVAAVAVAVALWRPARQGAALLGGAVLVMVAQAISALVQLGETVSPAQFGISPAQAALAGLTISSGATPVFWVYCLFLVGLALICTWLLLPSAPAFPVPPPAPPPAPPAGPATPLAAGGAAG